MSEIVASLVAIIVTLVCILIILSAIFGIPILFFAAIEAIYCFFSGSVFSWDRPVFIGVAAIIFICLVASDSSNFY